MTFPNIQGHAREPLSTASGATPGSATLACISLEARDALRHSAVGADARSGEEHNLAQFWQELARGCYSVVDGLFSQERCYLVVAPQAQGTLQPLTGRRLEILETVLSGLPQKNVASDLDLAPSTIALNARLALESRGMRCKPSRAHPLLMLAARVSLESRPWFVRCSSLASREGKELRVLSVARPDRSLEKHLPHAELAVIRRLIEGLSYIQIAVERGTSTRTIANQITAVFRRLHVSGRNELVQRLFLDQGQTHRISQPITQALSRYQIESGREVWESQRVSA
jgi:DNA-binding NarL/FixJ family response regulator